MVKQTQEDFKRQLGEQIHFLIKYCEEYDRGDYLFAKPMSVSLRNLLHDTSQSISILTHLSRKNMKFYDTSVDIKPENLAPEEGLIQYKVEVDPEKPTAVTFDPILGNGSPHHYIKGKLSFDIWWNHKILDNKQGITFTRRQLILAVCNKDGGAHIAAKLTKKYVDSVIKPNVLPISSKRSGGGIIQSMNTDDEIPPEAEGVIYSNVLAGSVRQIAYEVLKSLEDKFPEYFP